MWGFIINCYSNFHRLFESLGDFSYALLFVAIIVFIDACFYIFVVGNLEKED
ncbi:hypothetical protein IGI37_000931 [Enterococcus sp. AZ194]